MHRALRLVRICGQLWGLGDQGASTYRQGFCSRTLLHEFGGNLHALHKRRSDNSQLQAMRG